MGCTVSTSPACVIPSETLSPQQNNVKGTPQTAAQQKQTAAQQKQTAAQQNAARAWEAIGGFEEGSFGGGRPTRTSFMDRHSSRILTNEQRQSVAFRAGTEGDDAEDDDVEDMAMELAAAFGVQRQAVDKPQVVGNDSSFSFKSQEEKAGSFRQRKLSKELFSLSDMEELQEAIAAADAAEAAEAADAEEAAESAEAEQVGQVAQEGQAGQPATKQQLMAATATTAATRAAKAKGKALIMATEMQDREEMTDSFRNSADPQRKALAALIGGDIVGTFSCHGVEPAPKGGGEVAKINQDCACIAHPINGDSSAALFCVYDGHGEFGTEVSTQVLQSIRHALTEEEGASILSFGENASAAAAFGAETATLRDDPTRALTEAFEAVQVWAYARA